MAISFDRQRQRMVDEQIAARGVGGPAVLAALRAVPREVFLPAALHEFAYDDVSLPIGAGETLPRPCELARMLDALELDEAHRVLQIGAGGGYVTAVLAQIAGEVLAVERHEDLADTARHQLQRLGVDRAQVLHGDGTHGHPAGAPWDRILVLAGGPKVPPELKAQLADGGVLVIPVGESRAQRLIRLVRRGASFEETDLGAIRLVPLVGDAGFQPAPRGEWDPSPPLRAPSQAVHLTTAEVIAQSAEPLDDLETSSLDALLDRIGDARVVLLGEATHGTSEFYRMRARITQELITRKGFDIVAVEADWPDASRIDTYVRHRPLTQAGWQAFSRFPAWMWRNEEVLAFVEWLRAHNRDVDPDQRAGFYGLDLYSLYSSIDAVVSYLDDVDPRAAAVARERYGCLTAWEGDPATYGRAALSGGYAVCEDAVVAMLRDLLSKRVDYAVDDGDRFLDAAQNARLAANAERYYRAMYYGAHESWNLRDRHMFETLRALLDHRGPGSKAVVWEHNSHVGDAAATEFAARGELSVGQLCREHFGDDCYLIGFGTDHGTVAAANEWDGPMKIKAVRPSRPDSYEHLCHATGLPGFLLPLRGPGAEVVRERLLQPRLQRAIGVIYRPRTELQSHYFQAVLPRQFDEYIWFDETEAVRPLQTEQLEGQPDTFPFAL